MWDLARYACVLPLYHFRFLGNVSVDFRSVDVPVGEVGSSHWVSSIAQRSARKWDASNNPRKAQAIGIRGYDTANAALVGDGA